MCYVQHNATYQGLGYNASFPRREKGEEGKRHNEWVGETKVLVYRQIIEPLPSRSLPHFGAAVRAAETGLPGHLNVNFHVPQVF